MSNLNFANIQGTPMTLLILYVAVALLFVGVIFTFSGRVQV